MICYICHIKRSNGFVDENGIQLKTFTKKFMENNCKIHPTTVNEIPTVSGGNLIIDSFWKKCWKLREIDKQSIAKKSHVKNC